eukprot:scaffold5204_cov135-Cylindrotheca_fusiformis.AAC.3
MKGVSSGCFCDTARSREPSRESTASIPAIVAHQIKYENGQYTVADGHDWLPWKIKEQCIPFPNAQNPRWPLGSSSRPG